MQTANKNDNAQGNACCTAKETGQKVREFVDHAAHDARDTLTATERQIREHPVKASAIAAGLGFLLGALFRRR